MVMRIGVVSDSHGGLYMLDKAIGTMGEIDLLIHLGDHYQDAVKVNAKYKHTLIYVAGNNDFIKAENAEKLIEFAGRRIFLTHGHRYNVNFDLLQLEYKAQEEKADIVLFGHTHRYLVDNNNKILYLNPGSVSRPRDKNCSAAMLFINENGEVTVKKLIIE
jgi:uncharacterized protein